MALSDTPGITSSELARRAFVSRQSMNVLLQGLERQGLVERSSIPGPRRERAAELTDAAVHRIESARAAVAGVVDRMTAHLGKEDAAQLYATLASCRDALTISRDH